MRGETMKDKSKKSTYSTTFGVDPDKSKKSTYSTTFGVDPKNFLWDNNSNFQRENIFCGSLYGAHK